MSNQDRAELVPVPRATDLVDGIVPAHAIRSWEPNSIGEAMGLARVLANSTIIPTALRNQEGNVLAVMMFGRELGMTAMQSILGLWFEPKSGRPCLYSATLVGLVKKSKLCEWFILEHSDDTKATYATQRRGQPGVARMSFTIEQAKVAGYYPHKDNWKQNPAAMLRSRAAMHLARAVYEEIAAGIYDPDELDEPVQMTAPPPASAPAPSAPPTAAAPKVVDDTEPKPNSPEDIGRVPATRKPRASKPAPAAGGMSTPSGGTPLPPTMSVTSGAVPVNEPMPSWAEVAGPVGDREPGSDDDAPGPALSGGNQPAGVAAAGPSPAASEVISPEEAQSLVLCERIKLTVTVAELVAMREPVIKPGPWRDGTLSEYVGQLLKLARIANDKASMKLIADEVAKLGPKGMNLLTETEYLDIRKVWGLRNADMAAPEIR